MVGCGVVFSLDAQWPLPGLDDVQMSKAASVQEQASMGITERNTELFRHVPAHIQQKLLENIKNSTRPDSRIFQKQMDFRKVSSRLVYAACIKEV